MVKMVDRYVISVDCGVYGNLLLLRKVEKHMFK